MATSWSPSTTIHQQKIAEHKKATAANASTSSSTSIKTVYFTVGERKEVAVFEDAAPVDEIKSLFCSAAEAGPRDILKMYTPQGALINITNKLASNGPDAPYRLELVAAHHDEGWERVGEGLVRLEQRVTELEHKMRDHQQNQQMVQSQPTAVVRDLREQLDQLKRDLNSCGRTRYGQQGGLGRPYWNRTKGRRKSDEEKRLVCDKYLHISRMTLTEEIRRCLRMPTFDNWQWEDEEILLLLQQMYVDLNLCSKFAIDLDVLRKFLCQVYMNYNEVPFHNFQHCFTVSQMMYGIIWCLDLPAKIGDLETLILLTSCICHDLDHPGFNNIYQINAGTELALRYNDISPLENHHCSVAFNILEDTTANIFRSFAPDVYKVVREGIIRCILATDMARHNEILGQFNQIVPVFDYDNRAHINLLCMVLIKVSDISNEARPMDVAEPWLDCLLTEFYEQSDLEKKEGLPVTPFMDPEKISRPSSQCSFIGFVLLPLFESIAKLYPQLEGLIVQPVRDALDYYRKLNDASKESSSSSRQRSVDLLLPADSNSPATASTPGEDSNKTILAVADDTVDKSSASFKDDNLAVIGSNSNSLDRSISQEEIRRFSFGLEADERSFTEVEVCEKTFTFKISTDIRPAIGPNYWNKKSGEQAAAAALRRASFNALASPADILGRKIPRSANTSPVSSVTTKSSWNIAEEAEQKVPQIPRLVPALTINGLKDPPSETASGSSPSSTPSSPSLPTQVAANPKETEIIQQPETSCISNNSSCSSSATAVRPRSPAPTRDNAFFSRLKHWTDRLNPLGSSTDRSTAAAEESPSSPPVTPSSPAKSRRVLSRFFARSRSASSSPQLSRKSTASLDTVPT